MRGEHVVDVGQGVEGEAWGDCEGAGAGVVVCGWGGFRILVHFGEESVSDAGLWLGLVGRVYEVGVGSLLLLTGVC